MKDQRIAILWGTGTEDEMRCRQISRDHGECQGRHEGPSGSEYSYYFLIILGSNCACSLETVIEYASSKDVSQTKI